jgi:HSP20 family protein
MLVATVKPSSIKAPALITELDNLFNAVANQTFGSLAKDFTTVSPAVNIKESAKGYSIELAAPGLAKEDFKITLEKRTLKVGVQKETTKEEDNTASTPKVWKKEFSYFNFERSFNLPDTVDTEHIGANYEAGILHIVLHKKPEAAPKLINIG